MDLPLANADVSERADAARNRRRILAAASRLFAEQGVTCTTMDAIAAEAGVGKGTLFRRFGDRATLALAVLDESERELQEAILRGPAPLGPGAPAKQRLIAFGHAALDKVEQQADLIVAVETLGGPNYLSSSPRAARWMHIRALLDEAGAGAEGEYLADVLLAALSAPLYVHQREVREMSIARVKAGWSELVERLLR